MVLGPKEVEDKQVVQPLKDVIRMATQKDDAKEESNRKKEKEAYQICVKKIRAHQLEMKLIDVEYTFDNNKILFYFIRRRKNRFPGTDEKIWQRSSRHVSNCVRSV